MYVRGYLQGSENGRVVTIERMPTCQEWGSNSLTIFKLDCDKPIT